MRHSGYSLWDFIEVTPFVSNSKTTKDAEIFWDSWNKYEKITEGSLRYVVRQMLFSNMVNCCVAESFDLLDGYSLDLTIAKDKFKDIQMITSVQLVQHQSNEKGYSRITGLERLINLQEIYRYNRWVLLVMKQIWNLKYYRRYNSY